MQRRSRMAALTLVATLVCGYGIAARAGDPAPVKQKVKLSLSIDGLSAQGGDIEIKPGNAGCKFETIKFQTKTHPRSNNGMINLDPIEVETISADRNCSFAITLKEAGQPDKTVRRTLQIASPTEGKPMASQSLTCFISSNSRVARKTDETTRKK